MVVVWHAEMIYLSADSHPSD